MPISLKHGCILTGMFRGFNQYILMGVDAEGYMRVPVVEYLLTL